MKKGIFLIIAIIAFVFISCEDKDDKNKFKDSDLVGRWEFSHQLRNGVHQVVYPDQQCKFDMMFEFHANGTVTANDPCQWNKFVETKANWEIKGDKVFIDYYAIPGISVNPTILSVTNNELVLQQMYGDNVVVQNIFKRTTRQDLDYAAEVAGVYEGWMNYSQYYITNTHRGDSIWTKINVTRKNWGNISVGYENINILGSRRNLAVDSIQTTRYLENRRYTLSETTGNNMLFIDADSIYNIRSTGNQGTINTDSLYFTLNFSKIEFKVEGDPTSGFTENYKQFQRFRGTRKK